MAGSVDLVMFFVVVVYDVTVLTGDLWNAGTSANVYMTIYGERGDTGVRQLYTAAGEPEKFRMGQVSTVILNSRPLKCHSKAGRMATRKPSAGHLLIFKSCSIKFKGFSKG